MKAYSPSVDRNKDFILEILKKYLISSGKLLEVGSGTGQHAVFFAEKFPKIKWVTSDIKENHAGIKAWLNEYQLKNISGPEKLKIGVDDFPRGKFDFVFTANTLHIMSWKECKAFFKLLGKRLRKDSLFIVYGPFNYNGEFTSESNANYDLWLKERNELSGVRNFEDICRNMEKAGFELLSDYDMPANNRILVFKRLAFVDKK